MIPVQSQSSANLEEISIIAESGERWARIRLENRSQQARDILVDTVKQQFVVLHRFFGLNCNANFTCLLVSRWWFQICVIFTPIWGRCPI